MHFQQKSISYTDFDHQLFVREKQNHSKVWGYYDLTERRLFCSPRLHLLDQKYCKTMKYYFNLK